MNRFILSAVAGGATLAFLAPSSGLAHAATTYKTLNGPNFSTRCPSTFQTGSFTGKATFRDADAALFPILVGAASPDSSASILIGSRAGHDGRSRASTIEKTALTDLPMGYKRQGAVQQATTKIGPNSYLVSGEMLVAGKNSVVQLVYSTVLSRRTFYFFLTFTNKATTAERRGVGYVLGATRPV